MTKLDVTNRAFLADLTRPQLVALAVQKLGVTLAVARDATSDNLRTVLETTKGLQEPVRG